MVGHSPEGDGSLCCKSPCNDIQLDWTGLLKPLICSVLMSIWAVVPHDPLSIKLCAKHLWTISSMWRGLSYVNILYLQAQFLLAIYKNLFYIQFPTVLYQEWPVVVSGHILHPGGLSTTQTVSFSLCRCSTSCRGNLHYCLNLRLLQMTPLSQAGLLALVCRQSGELLVHPTGNK